MDWFKPANGKNYTEKEFHNVLHGILYLIIRNNGKAVENCKNSSDIFRYFRLERWRLEESSAMESVRAILDDIKFAMGVKLDKKEVG